MITKQEREKTILIVPVNDEEAALIYEIGKSIGMFVHNSSQKHGAKLENEKDIVGIVRESGKENVIIIEMPGPEIEDTIRAMVGNLIIIDHHSYGKLDRAHDAEGNILPSSLHQFLSVAGVLDAELSDLGFDPKMVNAIGLWDSNFIWGLLDGGFSKDEIAKFIDYKDSVGEKYGLLYSREEVKEEAEESWKNRKEWNGYFIIESESEEIDVRPIVSRLAAFEYMKPTPLIISERGGEKIYIQESEMAPALLENFGGFVFGRDRCWGYSNESSSRKITLDEVLEFLQSLK